MKIDTFHPMLFLGLLICHIGCRNQTDVEVPIYGRYQPPALDNGGDSAVVHAVVEIPAGTAVLQALDADMHVEVSDPVPVDFLPFPGNYGFITGCAQTDTITGETRPLPVLIMMQALREESLVAVYPVAVLMLTHDGKPYPIIIAIPRETDLRSIRARNFIDMLTSYDGAKSILQTWFLNYLGRDMFEFVEWRDEQYARYIISAWKINS